VSDLDPLADDLLGIYTQSGREVTYVTDGGETRPYWPNRYLQALKRAMAAGEGGLVDFVVRLVEQPEPSRGFHYLHDAGRLDISVEALVADPTRTYHHRFPASAVKAAKARLREYGYAAVDDAPVTSSETSVAQPAGKAETLVAVPITTSWGSTLKLGGREMTLTGQSWYIVAIGGLRPEQVTRLNGAILDRCANHASPQIGGNHVLEALLETGLYQRTWPGVASPGS